ncbi:hypothetical protein L4D76_13080 [Photobacterium sagamiensis]|uniref:hypothetical protein n=1 Tax=Photobacterium sagamiensis TaxID=2910241 RepID=UPI003D0CC279
MALSVKIQLRVEQAVEEFDTGWPGWDYEETPEPEPERSYADIIKSIPVTLAALFAIVMITGSQRKMNRSS